MKILQNFSLKKYNTFGINAKARYFVEVSSVKELKEIIASTNYPKKLFLGGGSNMLLTKDIDALVVHLNLKGKKIISETDDDVLIKVMAGENWHQLVLWSLKKNYGGLENMSLIPGNTGTAPIQNIGAYGVELKDTFISCEAIQLSTNKLVCFSKEECEFGYRESFFKNEGKDKYVIVSVTFSLTKQNHKLQTHYGAIESELEKEGIKEPSIKDISNAVISIRQRKLPDPNELGNSGSFFKNPIISKEEFELFEKTNPNAPFYKINENSYKIPAGWLIEQCGFKGKRYGDAGVHKNQALVLVNFGKASGQDILDLANKIIKKVDQVFHIRISPEVNLIK